MTERQERYRVVSEASQLTQDARADVDAIASTRRRKYGNTKVEVDGVVFDSKREAADYKALKLMQAAGAISGLTLQPEFELQSGFTDAWGKKWRPIIYRADFSFMENGVLVVLDTKGFKTAEFKLKEKLFRHRYRSIELRLT